ncbi:MAG: hypothetical protein R2771_10910 [Saprospiraceae bacterium]
MKNLRILKIFIFSIFTASLFSQASIEFHFAQDSAIIGYDIPLEIKTQSLLNGDDIALEMEYLKPQKLLVDTSKRFLDTSDFEISNYGFWKGHDNFLIFDDAKKENKISLKIWDIGDYIIKARVSNSDNIGIVSDTISVISGINKLDSLKNITPIKDIVREKKTFWDYLNWKIITFISILLLILLGYFIYRYLKNKPKKVEIELEEIDTRTPYEIAIEKLNKLKTEKPWIQGSEKVYHEELTYILREFLELQFGFNAKEQSTTEVLNSLKNIEINEDNKNTISDILNISDMVKFAKAKLELNINEQYLNRTIDLINDLNK